jgi:two-component system OmpR family response regulator
MLRKPKQVLTRDELMDVLYNREAGPFDRAVDVGIGRLRKKIEADPHSPHMIRSVRGAGYLLAVDVIRSHIEDGRRAH